MLLLSKHGCCLRGGGGCSVVHRGPAVGAPCDFVEQHLASIARCLAVYRVVEQPIVAIVVGDNLAVVAWAFPAVVGADDGSVVVVEHCAALFAQVGAEQFLAASHHCAVGAFDAFAAAAYAAE